MSWLRLDDKITRHPKLLSFDRKSRWIWLEILCFAAEFRSPVLPANIRDAVPHATPAFLRQAVAVGLLEETENGLTIHDWAVYQPNDPTAATRSKAYRDRNANRDGTVTESDQESRSPRAQARLSRPVPSIETDDLSPPNVGGRADATDEREIESNSNGDSLERLLRQLGLGDDDVAAARSEPARAEAIARLVLGNPTIRAPRAYWRKAWRSGEWPEGAQPAQALRPLVDSCRSFVENGGRSLALDDFLEVLAEREQKRGEQLSDAVRAELVERWRELQP